MDATLQDWLPAGLSLARYAAMAMVMAVAACMQGISGIGFAMLSAPLSALFFPELAPGPLLLLGGSLSLMTALREHASIDWARAAAALGGRVAGTLVAGWVLMLLSPRLLAVAFAGLILAGIAINLAGHVFSPSRRNIVLAGAASGLMATITSSGAPPFALVMQQMPPARLRATLGCVFAAGALVSLVLLAAVGRFGVSHAGLGLLLSPWMLLGFGASSRLNRWIPARALRSILLCLAAFGALGLLLQASL